MRDAIDPCPQRTAILESTETAPESDVNLLEQIPPLVGVGLIRVYETLQGRTVERRGLFIEIILLHSRIVCLAGICITEFFLLLNGGIVRKYRVASGTEISSEGNAQRKCAQNRDSELKSRIDEPLTVRRDACRVQKRSGVEPEQPIAVKPFREIGVE